VKTKLLGSATHSENLRIEYIANKKNLQHVFKIDHEMNLILEVPLLCFTSIPVTYIE
jgi:hypothetical protein